MLDNSVQVLDTRGCAGSFIRFKFLILWVALDHSVQVLDTLVVLTVLRCDEN